MKYDIYMCNGCKKNPFKKDRCTCTKSNDNKESLVFNIFFTSPSIKAKAIQFCIDRIVDGKSEKDIFTELKKTEFKIEKKDKKRNNKEITEDIVLKKNIFGEFVVKHIR